MSFCDVGMQEVMEGEASIILPPGKIAGFCNVDNAPLDHFQVTASLASGPATAVNAADEAARVAEETQQRLHDREEKTRAYRVQLSKRAAEIQRSLNRSRGQAGPRPLPHHELSKLVVRGSHIDASVLADDGVNPGGDAGGEGYPDAGLFGAVGPVEPLTQEEAELLRLSALTPVPLDQHRIQVALESQRARALLARHAHGHPGPVLPPPPVPTLPTDASAGAGGGVPSHGHRSHGPPGGDHAHAGHGHASGALGHGGGHRGHENCVPQWNTRAGDVDFEAERQKAVNCVAHARKVYMDRERRIVRARALRLRAARQAARAEAMARARAAEEERRARLEQQAWEAAEAARVAEERAQVAAAEDEASQQALQTKRREDEGRRFITALRKRAMDKIRARGITLPSLCKCTPGASILSAQWETCANNCPYYRNPAAYTRALADLFQTLDLTE